MYVQFTTWRSKNAQIDIDIVRIMNRKTNTYTCGSWEQVYLINSYIWSVSSSIQADALQARRASDNDASILQQLDLLL